MSTKDVKDYFKYCQEFTKEYGKKTVVWIEVGSFMEICLTNFYLSFSLYYCQGI